jgi:hypothetical protein
VQGRRERPQAFNADALAHEVQVRERRDVFEGHRERPRADRSEWMCKASAFQRSDSLPEPLRELSVQSVRPRQIKLFGVGFELRNPLSQGLLENNLIFAHILLSSSSSRRSSSDSSDFLALVFVREAARIVRLEFVF